jgi:hypothetical protein
MTGVGGGRGFPMGIGDTAGDGVVLPCAIATSARESEKMSAAITMEKNEAVLVEWLNI